MLLPSPLLALANPSTAREMREILRLKNSPDFLSEENQPLKTLQRYANIDLSKMQKLCFRGKNAPLPCKMLTFDIPHEKHVFWKKQSPHLQHHQHHQRQHHQHHQHHICHKHPHNHILLFIIVVITNMVINHHQQHITIMIIINITNSIIMMMLMLRRLLQTETCFLYQSSSLVRTLKGTTADTVLLLS